MDFKKYMHLERFGTTEVENIQFGECFIFPKIDGTNACVWLDGNGNVKAGSRNRDLTLDKDNAGFYAWVSQQDNVIEYLNKNPQHRLYGEWLVPHSLKTYRQDAWRRFYVFDVAIDKVEETEGAHSLKYLNYNNYVDDLKEFGLDFIPPLCIIKNADYESLISKLASNVFLIEDGKGAGEGIVIKNYDFRNKYGRTTFAKIVTSEFKEKHAKEMGGSVIKTSDLVEELISQKFITKALVEKTKSKIENENNGFGSKNIPQLLNTVYYELVKEEIWEILKEFKYPAINFKTLKHFSTARTKELIPELF